MRFSAMRFHRYFSRFERSGLLPGLRRLGLVHPQAIGDLLLVFFKQGQDFLVRQDLCPRQLDEETLVQLRDFRGCQQALMQLRQALSR